MAGPPPIKPARINPVPPPLNSAEGKAMAAERQAAATPADPELPAWRRGFRKATMWLWLAFLGCVVMQIALAGAGLLGDEDYWLTGVSEFIDAHRTFVHVVTLFSLLIAVAGFLGADRQAGWAGVAVFFLIGMQYPLVLEFTGVVRSFHVLNALIIFTVALLMTLARIPWRPHFLDAPVAPAAKPRA